MCIIEALNPQLKYTFDVFQKLFLGLDGLKVSAKVMGLRAQCSDDIIQLFKYCALPDKFVLAVDKDVV